MSRSKFAVVAALVLFVINIVLLGFIFINKPPGKGGPKHIIIEKLNFDPFQIEQYEKLIEAHKKEIDQANIESNRFRRQLYATLMKEEDDIFVDSIQEQIGLVQVMIENIHYAHFLEIKKLCRPEQLPAFEDLSMELASYFGSPHRPQK